MRTRAEQRVIGRFKEIGGPGWIFTSKEKTELETFDIKSYVKGLGDFYGKKEKDRLVKRMERHQVTDKLIWCSNKIYTRLINEGIIEPIEGIPGCFKLKETNEPR